MSNVLRPFNLPMLQHTQYQLVLAFPKNASISSIAPSLAAYGFLDQGGNVHSTGSVSDWQKPFALVRSTLTALDPANQPEVRLYCGEEAIDIRKSLPDMLVCVDSLWLGEALLENRLHCYLQPVCKAGGEVIGYESFARVHTNDGNVMAGDAIMEASHALGIEFAIDKYLHTQAIATFSKYKFDGLLFVNFFPGFIQRPAIYLDGLLQAAAQYVIDPVRLVLDMTNAETRSDMRHIEHVCEFAKAQGCSVALDDVESLTSARKLIPATRADFIKIDRELTKRAHQPGEGEVIASMVTLARQHGARTIGEGVETQEMLTALQQRGVDLFQGYYFAAPMHAEAMLKKQAG